MDRMLNMSPISSESVKDWLLIASAISGAVVAWVGLGVWRTQLRGTTEYDLARRFLLAAYKLRDEFVRFRNPVMSADEMAIALTEFDVTAEVDSQEASRAGYTGRWNRIADASRDFSVEALEAEVLWKEPARDSANKLQACARRLNAALATHEEFIWKGEGVDLGLDVVKKVRRDLFQLGSDPTEDDFLSEVASAMVDIEAVIKPHLGK
jgi:hypothetical protein